MVAGVKKLAADWRYDVVSIGYPGPVLHGRPTAEPVHLGHGGIGFDFAVAFGRPVKVVNDAALQAVGSYDGGNCCFSARGTGLGTALIVDGEEEPMELGHCRTRRAPMRATWGAPDWSATARESGDNAVERLADALLQPDETVTAGGNVKKLNTLTPRCLA
jgi:polyphosphate glucokinase